MKEITRINTQIKKNTHHRKKLSAEQLVGAAGYAGSR